MKKTFYLFIVIAVAVSCGLMPAGKAYCSDYQGNEKDDSVFQKIGDFITGKYEVNNKPLKKAGIFQVIADETKKIEPASSGK